MTRVFVLGVLLAGCSSWEPYAGDPVCPDILTCPEPVSVACSSAQTAVEVADAESCDLASVSDDRLETYGLGQSTVTYTAEVSGASGLRFADACATTVEVFDDVPPIVVCPSSVTLARSAPDAPWPAAPAGEARDACDDVTISVTPEVLSQRQTDVETRAEDGSGNAATCTTPVEVLDLFAVDELRLLAAERVDGSTEIRLGWEGAPTADVDLLDVQFSESADGPWTTVESVDADASVVDVSQEQRGFWRVVSRSNGVTEAGGASPSLEVHAVAEDAYNLSDVSMPGIPFATSLYGVVRHPADLDQGPFPLVVLMHGNHGNCRRNGTRDDACATLVTHECDFDGYSAAPNAEGMVYQAETLAAQGVIAVTVSANALNCRGGYIQERAWLLRGHVAQWAAWNTGEAGLASDFSDKVDLSRVGLVGHSRGGDAVANAPNIFNASPIPGVEIASIFAIAPTDYDDATVVDAPFAVLLPACDGDVSNLWGSDLYERSDDLPERAQVFFAGANHNYFSTEWAFDDGRRVCRSSALVGLEAQTSMLEATLGSWMRTTLNGERPEAWHRSETGTPLAVQAHLPASLDLRWAYTHANAEVVEDMVDPAASTRGTNALTGFASSDACTHSGCGSAFLARTSAIALRWDAEQRPSVECRFDEDSNTGAFDAVSFRIVSRSNSANAGLSQQAYAIVITDDAGQEARLSHTELTRVPVGYSGFNVREVLQSVRVPFATLEANNPDIDTASIASVSIELGTDGSAGAVTLTDVELGD